MHAKRGHTPIRENGNFVVNSEKCIDVEHFFFSSSTRQDYLAAGYLFYIFYEQEKPLSSLISYIHR